MIKNLLKIYFLFFIATTAKAQEKPPLPFYDWGACPFECCTYKNWEATRSVDVYETFSEKSTKLFKTIKSEQVEGLTGVVITSALGVTRIIKRVNIGYQNNSTKPELSLEPGERIYTIHYFGEGYDLFWYKGRTLRDQIAMDINAWGHIPFTGVVKIESRPVYKWWVKIRNHEGLIGWSDQPNYFKHIDACE